MHLFSSPGDKNMIIDTIDILVIGSGKLITQNVILKNKIAEFHFLKETNNSKRRKYQENLSKFLNLSSHNDKRQFHDDKIEQKLLDNPDSSKKSLKIGEFDYITQTFASDKFLLNMNFHIINDMAVDPYISDYITSKIDMCIVSFNKADIVKYFFKFSKLILSLDRFFQSFTVI